VPMVQRAKFHSDAEDDIYLVAYPGVIQADERRRSGEKIRLVVHGTRVVHMRINCEWPHEIEGNVLLWGNKPRLSTTLLPLTVAAPIFWNMASILWQKKSTDRQLTAVPLLRDNYSLSSPARPRILKNQKLVLTRLRVPMFFSVRKHPILT